MNTLEIFLRAAAHSVSDAVGDYFAPRITYSEDVNPDAVHGNAWLDNDTSYIWKVGTLGVVDSNKADWVVLYIGHQRSPDFAPELIGKLYWQDGENDDVGRCLRRYIKTLDAANIDPVFHDD